MSYERMVGRINTSTFSKIASIDVTFVVKSSTTATKNWKVTELMAQEGSLFLEYDENIIEMNRNQKAGT